MIYTVGYQNITRKNLISKLAELNCILVDIRFSPYGFSPFWNKNELENVLGEKYVHIKELGNVNYKNGKQIEIDDLDEGMKRLEVLLEIHKNICLMCSCKNFPECHRSFLSREIKEKYDIDTIEI